MSEHKFENDVLIRRFRHARETGEVSAAFWVQTERDLVDLLEQHDRLKQENERMKAIVDLVGLKKENDALRLKLKELTSE